MPPSRTFDTEGRCLRPCFHPAGAVKASRVPAACPVHARTARRLTLLKAAEDWLLFVGIVAGVQVRSISRGDAFRRHGRLRLKAAKHVGLPLKTLNRLPLQAMNMIGLYLNSRA